MNRKNLERAEDHFRQTLKTQPVGFSLALKAALQIFQGQTFRMACSVSLPSLIEHSSLSGAYWHAIVHAGEPQFLGEFEPLALRKLSQRRKIREFHRGNLAILLV
ncbi:MAG TPA: hypothetical protein VH597_11080 [Verrucomicrobiae bacterium]|jgi:hypothetical protein|nr:hypothetical protein [Verrucomicrobiae bacterium]